MCFKRMSYIRGDITKMKVGAIVNAANSSLLGGGGVDGAIHRSAGRELYNECLKLNGCPTGEAKITRGYNLPAKYVIHTVGPVWHGGGHSEEKLLASCYKRSLEVAAENGITSVAFPAISTGVYGFPFEPASRTAITSVADFLNSDNYIEMVTFVLFSLQDYESFAEIFKEMAEKF